MGEYEGIGSSVGNAYAGSIFPPFFLFFPDSKIGKRV
jgi:hypothetical protein